MADVTRAASPSGAGADRWVEVGIAGRPLQGEASSGDRAVVRGFAGGVLLAAVDALGHGTEAAEVAARATELLEKHAGESLLGLIRRCDAELTGTRGAAISLAALDAGDATLTWLGVGNVEGTLWRRQQSGPVLRAGLVTRSGVVGVRLPPLRAGVVPVARGDTLVLATDGVAPDFADAVSADGPPQVLADWILGRFGRANDDALVVAARFVMGP